MHTPPLHASTSGSEGWGDRGEQFGFEDQTRLDGDESIKEVQGQSVCSVPVPHGATLEPNEGFCPAYFERLAVIEPKHFWFFARNRLICGMLRRYFPSVRSLMEIGCGTGFVLEAIASAFPHLKLVGSEYFPEGLTVASRRLGSRAVLCQMDARHIPQEATFDVIGAFDVLEHIAEDERVLQQMRRATRPGGGILLTVPQHRFLWSRFDEASCHQRRYTRGELLEKVRLAGFEIVRATSFVSLLFPLLLLKRLGGADRVGGDPFDEFQLSGGVNWTLKKVLAFERFLIMAGASFPFGGSLFIIARRPW